MSERPVDEGSVRSHFDRLAAEYDRIKRRNRSYHDLLKRSVGRAVPPGSRVLEIGTATGEVLQALKPSYGVGIDLSPKMIEIARSKFPGLRFEACSFETFRPRSGEAFDYIVLADVIEHVPSAADLFKRLRGLCGPATQVVLTMANPAWEPLLEVLEKAGMKMQEGPHFRITEKDVLAAAASAGFRLAASDRSVLVPLNLGPLSDFVNGRLVRVPPFDRLALILLYRFAPAA